MEKINTITFSDSDKYLIMRIGKVNNMYLYSNKAQFGTFYFESSSASFDVIERRLVEIKCIKYNDSTILVAEDIIPNTSNIGIYLVDESDYVSVYVSKAQFWNITMTNITCDNPSVYEYFPCSNIKMPNDATYVIPTQMVSIKEIQFSWGSGFEASGRPQTFNKIYLNECTHMLNGNLVCTVSSSFAGGESLLFSCDLINNQVATSRPTALYVDVQKTDNTWTKVQCRYDSTLNGIVGFFPSTTSKVLIDLDMYINDSNV